MNFDELKQQWQDLEEWKKILIVIIFTGAFIYLIYVFKIENTLQEKENLKKEIRDLQNRIALYKRKNNKQQLISLEKKIKEIQKETKQKEKELRSLKDIIPEKANINEVLYTIASNIQKTNLIMDELLIKGEEPVAIVYDKVNKRILFKSVNEDNKIQGAKLLLKKVNIELNLRGKVKYLMEYINKLSKSKRYLKIHNAKIKNTKAGTQITLNLSTYYMQGGE